MSKSEILAGLPMLTPQERDEVRQRLAELDGEGWLDDGTLTDAEKNLIEQRLRELDSNPSASIPWEAAKSRLLATPQR